MAGRQHPHRVLHVHNPMLSMSKEDLHTHLGVVEGAMERARELTGEIARDARVVLGLAEVMQAKEVGSAECTARMVSDEDITLRKTPAGQFVVEFAQETRTYESFDDLKENMHLGIGHNRSAFVVRRDPHGYFDAATSIATAAAETAAEHGAVRVPLDADINTNPAEEAERVKKMMLDAVARYKAVLNEIVHKISAPGPGAAAEFKVSTEAADSGDDSVSFDVKLDANDEVTVRPHPAARAPRRAPTPARREQVTAAVRATGDVREAQWSSRKDAYMNLPKLVAETVIGGHGVTVEPDVARRVAEFVDAIKEEVDRHGFLAFPEDEDIINLMSVFVSQEEE